jgi:hypothetical protein
MCLVSEGGGDVMPAEIHATEKSALDAVNGYASKDKYWGCVDWCLNEVGIAHLMETD